MRPALLLAAALAACAPRLQPTDGAGWRSAFADCQRGDQGACLWVGVSHEHGGDYAEARALYERACEASVADACADLGLLFQRGRGVERDVGRAFRLLQRACDLGSASGCHDLGVAWYRGLGVERAVEKSTPLYRRGCALGSALSCADYGKAVGEGRGVPKDPALARALWRQACPAEGLACLLLAGQLEAEAPAQALAVAREGCRAGDGACCVEAGALLAQGKEPALAARYYRTACAWGDELGCQDLGTLVAVPRSGLDGGEVGEVLAASCQRGQLGSCYELAAVGLRLHGPGPEVVARFEDTCRRGFPLGCEWYCRPRGRSPEDAARAAEVCQGACRQGVAEACAGPADAGTPP